MDFFLSKGRNESGATLIYVGVHKDFKMFDDFDIMLDIMRNHCECEVISDDFVIYERISELSKAGVRFFFVEDFLYGNYLCVNGNSDVSVIDEIANVLVEGLRIRANQIH
ncbi:MAG: hypothetical protein LBN02_03120 [Oscillospiraceae bacterium]|nr:hypothetical protein [Oscillospiraceae bacterium]